MLFLGKNNTPSVATVLFARLSAPNKPDKIIGNLGRGNTTSCTQNMLNANVSSAVPRFSRGKSSTKRAYSVFFYKTVSSDFSAVYRSILEEQKRQHAQICDSTSPLRLAIVATFPGANYFKHTLQILVGLPASESPWARYETTQRKSALVLKMLRSNIPAREDTSNNKKTVTGWSTSPLSVPCPWLHHVIGDDTRTNDKSTCLRRNSSHLSLPALPTTVGTRRRLELEEEACIYYAPRNIFR